MSLKEDSTKKEFKSQLEIGLGISAKYSESVFSLTGNVVTLKKGKREVLVRKALRQNVS